MKKVILAIILLIPPLGFAKPELSGRFDMCSKFIEKNGVRFELGQVWFSAGETGKDSKPLTNYTVDYNLKPFAHDYTFVGIPKGKLWLDCVYFACGDAACSPDSSSSEPESVYTEIKKIPTRCQSKARLGNAARVDYFVCSFDKTKPSKNK